VRGAGDGGRALWCLYNNIDPTIMDPPSWLHLNLIFSLKYHLWASHLGFNIWHMTESTGLVCLDTSYEVQVHMASSSICTL
jgi:hypothetical protein